MRAEGETEAGRLKTKKTTTVMSRKSRKVQHRNVTEEVKRRNNGRDITELKS